MKDNITYRRRSSRSSNMKVCNKYQGKNKRIGKRECMVKSFERADIASVGHGTSSKHSLKRPLHNYTHLVNLRAAFGSF